MTDINELPPSNVLGEVKSQTEDELEYQKQAAEWLLSDASPDGLVPRNQMVQALSKEVSIPEGVANRVVSGLVGDVVDPVQQVVHPEHGKLVGIIEYNEYPESGCYGYVNYDDVTADAKRVVCSRCVETAEVDTNVTHATAGEGSMSEDAEWGQLVNRMEDHYADRHEVSPDNVIVGASLASGTTVSGNTAFHLGNDGQGSGLDADTVDGKQATDLGGPSTLSQFMYAVGYPTTNADLEGRLSLNGTLNHTAPMKARIRIAQFRGDTARSDIDFGGASYTTTTSNTPDRFTLTDTTTRNTRLNWRFVPRGNSTDYLGISARIFHYL